ncbi:cytochrome c oxidase assembly protein [Sandaracinobacteroides saxicola]|uniref:Cytochrome c oxidase assembly protein CtaG n=1 Tax=Sandaracinobacteroides saxicola TaxID=2759707 RepID=A0A7G5IGZ5_9SPHN|nr:cytochrome c oxidase assembly protein [Sandaracinobacteroides saxicola]QMW22637.1 cytochrome c oxidase assembly protein [Sandaracinobacteroides saxicola]
MATSTTANRRTGLIAALIALGMVGLAYASVPLYRIFCQVTGFGGTTQKADASALPDAATLKSVAGKTIRVRFDGNSAPGMPWAFHPVENSVTVKIGERKMAFYRATNQSAATVTGTATFNVSPESAGRFFNKIQCFCFNEQTLKPGQTVDMPVVYFIDPAILDDPDAKRIDEITLSYTFFPVDKPTQPAQITTTSASDIAARR